MGEPSPGELGLLRALSEQGFAVIPGYLTAGECGGLVKEVEQVFSSAGEKLWRSEDGADVRAYAAETRSADLARYNSDASLQRLAELYLGVAQVPFFTLANRIQPTPGNLGSGGGWHRDSVAEHQFKSILYLTDVDPGSGPFQFVPGSHRVRSIVRANVQAAIPFGQHRYSEQEIARVCETRGITPKTFTGAAGTLIVADTSGLHRGMPISRGQRYALTNYFMTPAQVANSWRQGKFVKNFVGDKVSPARSRQS